MNIKKIQDKIAKFANERDWEQFHSPKNLAMALTSEAGELSEIFGSKTLYRDRSQRRKGIVYAAKRTLVESKKDIKTYNLLNAYVDGINDYIETLSYKDYPIEYKILNYKPQKWTLLKCFLLMEQMSDMLSSGDMDIEDTYLVNTIGIEKYNLLFLF